MHSSTRAFSMQRALGGGPEALAMGLAALWLLAIVALPLEHAMVHEGDDAGHCHTERGALVCHGGDRAEDEAAISDGSQPVLGELSLAHGAIAFIATPPLTVLPPVRTMLPVAPPIALSGEAPAEHHGISNARGPPSSLLFG